MKPSRREDSGFHNCFVRGQALCWEPSDGVRFSEKAMFPQAGRLVFD